MGILRTDRVSGLGGANAITGSTFFGGSGNHLRVEGIDDDFVTWWTADFTIEAWIFVPAIEKWYHDDGTYSFPVMVGHMNPTTSTNYWSFGPTENNIIKFYYWKGSQNHSFVSTATVKENEWTHIAMTFSTSNGAKLFVNGTGTDYISLSGTPQVSSSNAQFLVGQYFNDYLTGNISNLRILKGTALYTSDFTPPTNRLEKTSDTKLLICNSASDVTHNDDEKIITPVRSSTNNTGPVASAFTPNSPVGFSTTTDVGTQFGSTFDGVTTFDSQAYMVPPGGNTRERNRGRGLHAGGEAPSHSNIIDFIQIQSGGIAQDFGDLITLCNSCDGVASKTRAVFATFDSPNFNLMEFVTIATTGNGTDFGDQTVSTGQEGSTNNDTIGLFAGGYQLAFFNHIEKITIATAGNAVDFGDLINPVVGLGGAADTTRGVFAGGIQPGSSYTNIIQKVEFATTADATDFGDLSVARRNPAGTSDSTRGIFAGGNTNTPTNTGLNTIDFITIQTLGNAVDFGDMPREQADASGTSDSIRGVFSAGYYGSPYLSNVIEKVIIQSTGNAVDYGDLSVERIQGGSVSDSHGGLS